MQAIERKFLVLRIVAAYKPKVMEQLSDIGL